VEEDVVEEDVDVGRGRIEDAICALHVSRSNLGEYYSSGRRGG